MDPSRRRAIRRAHASRPYFCSCGRVVRGNGGRAQHKAMHVRMNDGHRYLTESAYENKFGKDPVKPLNGEKTHPLSSHALDVLARLQNDGPVPTQELNPGVVNRFRRESLTETVMRPSPYKCHRGADTAHEAITEAGRALLHPKKGGRRLA